MHFSAHLDLAPEQTRRWNMMVETDFSWRSVQHIRLCKLYFDFYLFFFFGGGGGGGVQFAGILPNRYAFILFGAGVLAGQGLAVPSGVGLICPIPELYPSLWETARYRLKYCLKGPLNPKQSTNPSGRRL